MPSVRRAPPPAAPALAPGRTRQPRRVEPHRPDQTLGWSADRVPSVCHLPSMAGSAAATAIVHRGNDRGATVALATLAPGPPGPVLSTAPRPLSSPQDIGDDCHRLFPASLRRLGGRGFGVLVDSAAKALRARLEHDTSMLRAGQHGRHLRVTRVQQDRHSLRGSSGLLRRPARPRRSPCRTGCRSCAWSPCARARRCPPAGSSGTRRCRSRRTRHGARTPRRRCSGSPPR